MSRAAGSAWVYLIDINQLWRMIATEFWYRQSIARTG
jgi:hypothetical protein